jgi:hypothetical protein
VHRFAPLIATALIAGCGTAPLPEGREFRIALSSPIGAVDGVAKSGWGILLSELVFEGLLTVDDSGRLSARLASRWERTTDGGMRFWLRPDATFSDGTPATAAVVADCLLSGNLRAEAMQDVLVLHARKAGAPLVPLLLYTVVVRAGPAGAVGTGPFVVASNDGSKAILRRRVPAPGRIETVIATSYNGEKQAAARILRGEADFLPQFGVSSAEFFEGIAAVRVLPLHSRGSLTVSFGPGRFSREERLQLAASLPVDEIRTSALGDACHPWPRTRPPQQPLPAGRPLDVLVLRDDPAQVRVAVALRRSLGARGGALHALDLTATGQAISAGEFDLLILPMITWPAGMLASPLHSASPFNHLHYSNPAVDAALERGEQAPVLEALEQDPPVVFLCSREGRVVITSRVKNPRLGVWDRLEFLSSWELAP